MSMEIGTASYDPFYTPEYLITMHRRLNTVILVETRRAMEDVTVEDPRWDAYVQIEKDLVRSMEEMKHTLSLISDN